MTRTRPTLGAWLALLFSALTVLLTLVITLVIERSASKDVAASIGANLAMLAHQTGNRLDRGMFERHREVQLMSVRLARLADPAAVQAELDAAKGSYRYYLWLGVVDAQGIVQAASGGRRVGEDVSGQTWFRQALDGVNLGPVREEPPPGRGGIADAGPQRVYDVAFPMRRPDGSTALLAAQVSWDWARNVREAVFGAGPSFAELLVLTPQGLVVLGPDGVEGRTLRLASLREANEGRYGHLTERFSDGRSYVVGYDRSQGFLSSPGLGWRILVRQDTDSAYAPVRSLQQRVALGGAGLALLFSVLGWLAARQITRPLLALATDARRLEQGEAQQVRASKAYREVESLGAALNSLLAKLRHNSGELQALNARLEERVEQRTAELRQAFERVRANEQRIQTIIEAAQDPFIGIDLQGRISDWSTQAEVSFGWGREEVLGKRAGELLLPAGDARELEAALDSFVRTGRSGILNRSIERVMRDRHGREIPVELKMGLVDTGAERFFGAFVHDISQRKEVERMKDEFISTVSHELRTPLTSIYGSLNLLASGAAGELPADAKQLLAISHESTERLVRLINDMLDLEKLASGKLDYRMQRQPLVPLVEQAIRDTRAYAEGLRVRFEAQVLAHPIVEVDADRIVQLCVNLLSNAAKFSPPAALVTVCVEERAGRARVGVVDRGPGVPQDFRERMFQRFAQADASDRRARGGTGLGLAISRSIVEAHGGLLDFSSEPQVRTEFFFELPLAAR